MNSEKNPRKDYMNDAPFLLCFKKRNAMLPGRCGSFPKNAKCTGMNEILASAACLPVQFVGRGVSFLCVVTVVLFSLLGLSCLFLCS